MLDDRKIPEGPHCIYFFWWMPYYECVSPFSVIHRRVLRLVFCSECGFLVLSIMLEDPCAAAMDILPPYDDEGLWCPFRIR